MISSGSSVGKNNEQKYSRVTGTQQKWMMKIDQNLLLCVIDSMVGS